MGVFTPWAVMLSARLSPVRSRDLTRRPIRGRPYRACRRREPTSQSRSGLTSAYMPLGDKTTLPRFRKWKRTISRPDTGGRQLSAAELQQVLKHVAQVGFDPAVREST